MPKGTKKDKRILSVARLVLYVIAASVLLLLVGNVIAKYTYSSGGQTAISATEFYFTSDVLSDSEVLTYTLASTASSFEMILKNHQDELRFSERDISYTVSVKESGAEVVRKTGSLSGGGLSSETISVPVESGKTYTVTATGEAGFAKTLKATVIVLPPNNILYKSVENTNAYVELTVWAQDVSGELFVDFPDGVIPDNTDDAMKDVLTADGEFVDTESFSEAFSSHAYRFFKTSSGEIGEDAFVVRCAGVEATPKTPDR